MRLHIKETQFQYCTPSASMWNCIQHFFSPDRGSSYIEKKPGAILKAKVEIELLSLPEI